MGEIIIAHRGRVVRRIRFPYDERGVEAVREIGRLAMSLARKVTRRAGSRKRSRSTY